MHALALALAAAHSPPESCGCCLLAHEGCWYVGCGICLTLILLTTLSAISAGTWFQQGVSWSLKVTSTTHHTTCHLSCNHDEAFQAHLVDQCGNKPC